MANHIHLDLVGGLSGDMFIAGMLDAFPEFTGGLDQVIVAAGFPELVELTCQPHNDGILTGTRFEVTSVKHEHHHRHYAAIKESLSASDLNDAVKQGALSIFALIAEVEAEIHGKKVEEVAFHEVGAWDSIADIVLAAHLIDAVKVSSWSVSAIPIGRGLVDTAHGRLPVPAPATAKLLQGFEVFDDGIDGERVTPTGAAILKYLAPSRQIPAGLSVSVAGYGFGKKVFPGLSNTVRVSTYSSGEVDGPLSPVEWHEDQVMRLSFELDDQTPESIALAVEQLRDHESVLDVTQQAFWGKKNRQGFAIVVLVKMEATDEVTEQCFSLTTTLGVRRERVDRAILQREEIVVYVNERAYRVKVARRPAGLTAKVEMDDLIESGLNRAEMETVRVQAELLAVKEVEKR